MLDTSVVDDFKQLSCCKQFFYFYLFFVREGARTLVQIAKVSEGSMMLCRGQLVACELQIELASLRHTCDSPR